MAAGDQTSDRTPDRTPAPLVHIGYPKCASTFLQRVVFPRSAGLYTQQSWERLSFDRFVQTDTVDFDAARVAAEFTVPADVTGPVRAVISNENLVGGTAARVNFSEQVADRLVRTFPDASIVLVVREQRSMLLSLYRQLVKRGESLRLREAIMPTGVPAYYPRLRMERLRYHQPLALYRERFGPDRVRVLPFEWLVRDDREFVRQLLEFATGQPPDPVTIVGERENVGYRGRTLELRRRLNVVAAESFTGPGGAPRSFRLARATTSAVDRLLPDSTHAALEAGFRATVAEVVGDTFVESNRILAEQTGLDLGALGYSL